ncbi:hypothetical protein Acsp02_59700 [Actinoplanes sp. NBRC 103695]|nr:hypothetical protein Acsp02_59700 [Actinoplanes sp. NBRC 103695]
MLAGAVLGAVLAPGAALADGPGYGGTADSLTVEWQAQKARPELAVYAVGFKGGSPVRLRVGSGTEESIAADTAGALKMLVAQAGGRLAPGTSVVAVGKTPAGALRTLVGSVPPPAAGTGLSDMAPWTAAVALAGAAVAATVTRSKPGRHRPGKHRATAVA